MKNISKQAHYDEASKNFKSADEVVLDDETANTYKEKFTLKNLDSRVEEIGGGAHLVGKIGLKTKKRVAKTDRASLRVGAAEIVIGAGEKALEGALKNLGKSKSKTNQDILGRTKSEEEPLQIGEHILFSICCACLTYAIDWHGDRHQGRKPPVGGQPFVLLVWRRQ